MTGLGAYARWHARDALAGPVLSSVLLAVALTGITVYGADRMGLQVRRDPAVAATVLGQATAAFALLGGIAAAVNTLGTDRKEGHYRFLFSRAVSVPAYYAQLLGVRFGLLLGATTAFVGLLALAMPVERPLAGVQGVALVAGLTIAVGALVGALTHRESAWIVFLFLLETVLHGNRGILGPTLRVVHSLLPPWGRALSLREALLDGRALPDGDVALVVGYAVGAVLLALVAIRRLPLAR